MSSAANFELLRPGTVAGQQKKSALTVHVSLFVIGALIGFVVLYLLKPTIVRKKVNDVVTADIDTTRLVISSLVVGLAIVVIAWLVRGGRQ